MSGLRSINGNGPKPGTLVTGDPENYPAQCPLLTSQNCLQVCGVFLPPLGVATYDC
jgi:hypothetical protein